MLTIQYLGDGAASAAIAPDQAAKKLRAACRILQFESVIIGWNLPESLIAACREETERAAAKLYLWHPLFCSDGSYELEADWLTESVSGASVRGYQDIPEFSFACANNPQASERLLARLDEALDGKYFQGVFLDRMRLPSPAPGLEENLACFCPVCHLEAEAAGLDLAEVRREIKGLLGARQGVAHLARWLLAGDSEPASRLGAYQAFRGDRVSHFVERAVRLARDKGMGVGLDCFSPLLTASVGQDMATLAGLGDWLKVMCYGHTLGPAGLPFELLGYLDWLVGKGYSEAEALKLLVEASGLLLPASRGELAGVGLSSQALACEVARGREAGVKKLLAGLELVKNPAAVKISERTITADAQAMRQAGADGLALSWDLWHMPLEWLGLLAEGNKHGE